MNNFFPTSNEMTFFKMNKSSRTSKPRKRRANSDSELTFMDGDSKSFFNHNLLTMHSDDIDIDIMADAHSDNTVLCGSNTMDPSQMFIMLTNPQSTFSYSPPQDVMNLNSTSIDTTATDVCAASQIMSPSVLDGESAATDALFQTQIYFVDTGIPGTSACLTAPHTDASHLTDEQVTGIYAIQTNPPVAKTPKDPLLPAKFFKNKASHSPKPVPSQVDTADGKDDINQKWITIREEKNDLKEKGCKWKSGVWSRDEEELLRNNIDSYCKGNSIGDPTSIIFSAGKDERKAFYRSVSIGLNRPLFAVYRKVLRMYDHKNYVGKYSSEEVEKLKKLHEAYDNNWSAIGVVLGRSAASVKDRVRLLTSKMKRGRWEEDELTKLSDIVHKLTNTKKGESVTSEVNWSTVANELGTRSEKQCRTKWLHYLNWKEVGGKSWVKTDEIELINRIVRTEANEENEIDWDAIAYGWESARSPQWLRTKWWTIKKNAPDYQTCNFSDLMTYLRNTYVTDILSKQKKPNQEEEKRPKQCPIVQSDLSQANLIQSNLSQDTDGQSSLSQDNGNQSSLSPENNSQLSLKTEKIDQSDFNQDTVHVGSAKQPEDGNGLVQQGVGTKNISDSYELAPLTFQIHLPNARNVFKASVRTNSIRTDANVTTDSVFARAKTNAATNSFVTYTNDAVSSFETHTNIPSESIITPADIPIDSFVVHSDVLGIETLKRPDESEELNIDEGSDCLSSPSSNNQDDVSSMASTVHLPQLFHADLTDSQSDVDVLFPP